MPVVETLCSIYRDSYLDTIFNQPSDTILGKQCTIGRYRVRHSVPPQQFSPFDCILHHGVLRQRFPTIETDTDGHSIRGGTITGEHEVIFAGKDETLTISHNAISRSILATGSINAANFIIKQKPGMYEMSDLI